MFIVVTFFLLFSGCSTTTRTIDPTITDYTKIEGVGHRGERQQESQKVRVITETISRCCGPRGSILDIWNKQETVIRETDQEHEQIIHPIKIKGEL